MSERGKEERERNTREGVINKKERQNQKQEGKIGWEAND